MHKGMHRKRFNLPPLDLIQGFEAAARTLSFTKAAEELFITQSAVSRQIRALEDHLGVALFERRPRTLVLTDHGRILQGAATEFLERLQDTTNRLRSDGGTPHLTVTTTGGFASLWLIPRLRSFTALHPDVDVRISASYKTVNLERSLVDVAVRYCQAEEAQEDAIRLFGEELFPICSPALMSDNAQPHQDAGRPHPARAAAHRRGARAARLGHLARRAGPCRAQAGGFHPLRQLRADDPGGAERPGRRHGDRPSGSRADRGGPAGGAVLQERDRLALLFRHPLHRHPRAPARAGLRRLADRGGEGGADCRR